MADPRRRAPRPPADAAPRLANAVRQGRTARGLTQAALAGAMVVTRRAIMAVECGAPERAHAPTTTTRGGPEAAPRIMRRWRAPTS